MSGRSNVVWWSQEEISRDLCERRQQAGHGMISAGGLLTDDGVAARLQYPLLLQVIYSHTGSIYYCVSCLSHEFVANEVSRVSPRAVTCARKL